MRALKSLILFFLFFFSLIVFAFEIEEKINRSFPSTDIKTFEIENRNGDIRINNSIEGVIEINAKVKIKAENKNRAEEIKEKFLKYETVGNILKVSTDTKILNHYGFLKFLKEKVSITYEIKVPQNLNIRVISTNSDFSVNGIYNEAILETTNGDIEITGNFELFKGETTNGGVKIKGKTVNLEAETTNGDIIVETSEFKKVSLESTNGTLEVKIPENSSVSVEAKTSNGKINLGLPVTVKGTLSKNKIEGVIGTGAGQLKLKTTNGNININSNLK